MSIRRTRPLLFAAVAPLACSAALAQTLPAPTVAATEEPEAIVITGSRLPSTDLTASAPVTVLDRSEIDSTGITSVGELLRELPVASASATDTAGRGNNGSANVALRGLSAVNTLVLVNGRRMLANNSGGTVDLNSVPFEAVDRIEVLQDGASAVYGSDAIAGVVNLIMRRSYDGLLLKAGYGVSSRGDVPNREFSATFGQKFDRGEFVFVTSYRKASGNLISDRPISRDPDFRARGGRNFRDSAPLVSAFRNIDPANPSQILIIREGVTRARTLADFRPYVFPDTNTPLTSGNDGINYWEYESSASEISQFNAYFSGAYEINDSIKAFVEANHSSRRSLGFLAPDYFDGNVIVSARNDFNTFGRDLTVFRTLSELPTGQTRKQDVDSKLYRIVAGLEGEVGGFKWDLSANYQKLDQFTDGGRTLQLARLVRAAGDSAVCRTTVGCVPIDLFGARGSITDAMLQSITTQRFTNIDATLQSFVGNVAGSLFSLPAGDVGLAVGAEYRTETFQQFQDNDADKTTPTPPFLPPNRRIYEFYAETAIPVLKDVPFFHSLDVEAAVRYSHYNAFGSTTNPKVGVKWRPVADLLLRGSWGTGFRAPTFAEANTTQARGFRPITDPCQGANFAALPGCGGRRAAVVTGSFVTTGGNPNLRPETAETLTIGAVLTPSFVPRLSLTVDYFHIEKSNIIGTADVDYIIAQNAAGSAFANAVVRDAANSVIDVFAIRDNLLDQLIKGFDFGVEYTTAPSAIGRFNLRTDLTYLDSYKLSPAAGQPAVQRVGTYTTAIGTLAHWRATGRASWSLQPFSLSYGFRYVGPVRNDASLLVNGQRLRAKSYLQHDISASFDFEEAAAKFILGVENVTDRMPPFLEGNFANGFDNLTFNSRGRFFYVRVQKQF